MRDTAERSLAEALTEYAGDGRYPMHMPGHKRNTDRYEMINPYALDITEIEGFDDLHEPEGILRRGMERAARVCGAEESWYLVNGSTVGILAAVGACVRRGDRILVVRNCHKSVYHAMELYHLEPIYIYPDPVGGTFRSIAGSIAPGAVARALAEAEGTVGLAVLTSPTYEGVISDVASIAEVCHRAGVPLLVDEAHGAHLELTDGALPCQRFPAGALAGGADLVVQSLHKTLPAFTQTALLHRQGDLVSGARVKHFLDILQTSSPSYLLMAGIDRCIGILERERTRPEGAFPEWRRSLETFYRGCGDLRVLRVLGAGNAARRAPSASQREPSGGLPGIFDRDPSKLVISAGQSGHTGGELMDALREEGFEPEMASADYVIAMTGAGDRWDMLEEFAAALHRIDARWETEQGNPRSGGMPCAARSEAEGARSRGESGAMDFRADPVIPLWEAAEAEGEYLPWEDAEGRISAEYLYAYPPGIPLLAPGERITGDVLKALRHCRENGVSLRGAVRASEGVIRTAVLQGRQRV